MAIQKGTEGDEKVQMITKNRKPLPETSSPLASAQWKLTTTQMSMVTTQANNSQAHDGYWLNECLPINSESDEQSGIEMALNDTASYERCKRPSSW